MSLIEVKVPDIGDFSGVDVIEVNVKPGDVIEKSRRSSRSNPIKPPWKCPATSPAP